MSKHWRWFVPAYALLAPFALLYVAFLYATRTQPTAWRWHESVLTCISKRGALPFNAGGQGWSWVVAFADEDSRQAADLRAHEFTHVMQEFACCTVGVLAILVLALCGEWKIGVMAGLGGAAIFHIAYGATWAYSFIRQSGIGWRGTEEQPRWYRAYMSIPWEVHAYRVQDEFVHGLRADAWGSSMLHYRG